MTNIRETTETVRYAEAQLLPQVAPHQRGLLVGRAFLRWRLPHIFGRGEMPARPGS